MSDAFLSPRRVLPLESFTEAPRDLPKDLRLEDLKLLRAAAADILKSPAGRLLLDHLVDVTLRAPQHPPISAGPERYALECARRDGQNSIVLHLLALANQGDGEPGFIRQPPI